MIRALLAALIAGAAASGQPQRVEPPLQNLLFDRTAGTVDTVGGVPGGWYRTGSVLAGIDGASFSEDGRHAILVRGMHVSRLDSVPFLQETALFEADGPILLHRDQGPAALLLTPSSIFLVSPAGDWRQLPAPPLPVADLVVCGDTVVFSGSAGVFRIPVDGAPELLLEGGDWLITSSGNTVFAAERSSGRIVRLSDVAGAWTMSLLVAPSAAGTAASVAAIVADAGQVFVAYASRLLRANDAADGRLLAEWTLDSRPSGFERWGGRYWLLNAARSGGEPIQVFDRLTRAPGFLPARELP
ncbi:MAG: hypothetical protein K2X35_04395 [Bryobacteraceae bacterium]|nr:hypothetical protein [Bryobacteraceae bacterium]